MRSQWDKQREDRAAIQATAGTVLIRGCDFQEDKPHIALGEGVKRAIISANLTPGKLRLANRSQGVVKVGGNTGD